MRKDIPSLTGLRGVAALWVVFYHIHNSYIVAHPGAVLLRHGYLAVDIFFVLSGFVMALSYRDLFSGGFGWRAYATFLMRRFARVWPLFAFATLVAAAVYATQNWAQLSRFQFAVLLAENLAMVQSWGISYSLVGPAWSVSTEALAYLLFPVLAFCTIYARVRGAALAGLVGYAALCWISTLPWPTAYDFPRMGPLDIFWDGTPWPLVRCLAGFTMGLTTFALFCRERVRQVAGSVWFELGVALPLAAALCIPGTDLLIVALFPAFVLLLASREGWVTAAFSSRPALELGKLSYSMYLAHTQLHWLRDGGWRFFAPKIGPLAADIVATGLFYLMLFAVCWLCFHGIEAPARQAIRRVERRLFPREDRVVVAGRVA